MSDRGTPLPQTGRSEATEGPFDARDSLFAFRADAAMAAALVKNLDMTEKQAVAEVLRLKGKR